MMSTAPPTKKPQMARLMQTGSRQRQWAFTYPVVLGITLVMAVGASVTVPLASTQVQREREAELLFRGQAYRDAIAAYSRALPGQRAYPRSLEDLVRDPRFDHRRHIRRLYEDPLTKEDWLLIRGAGGGIVGVASRSRSKPLKTGRFPEGLEGFAQAGSYRDWQFIFEP